MAKLSSSQGFAPSSAQRAQEQNPLMSWSRKEGMEGKKEIQALQKYCLSESDSTGNNRALRGPELKN